MPTEQVRRVDLDAHNVRVGGRLAQAQMVQIGGRTFSNVYYPPDETDVTLENLVYLAECISDEWGIFGDFNAHHGAWGSDASPDQKATRRGNAIFDQMSPGVPLNSPAGEPTAATGNVLGLALVSPALHQLAELTILDFAFSGAHSPIIIRLGLASRTNARSRPRN